VLLNVSLLAGPAAADQFIGVGSMALRVSLHDTVLPDFYESD
jgi:hypothetical protein